MRRTRTGRRIELSVRDIELFQLLVRYRYLRSTYLHAFVGGASVTRFKERLGDLFHEGFLDRPQEQWAFADARYAPAVYALGNGAIAALRPLGAEISDGRRPSTASKQFLHALLTCETLASIELAARGVSGLRFVAWPELLARAPEPTRLTAAPLRLPVPSGGFLVPDAVFGIEYGTEATKTYRFFALEADRGTMPISRSKPGQTSYLGKLGAYSAILASQVHKTHWGIPNLLVLTLTTSTARAAKIVAKLGTGNPAFLFKVAEGAVLTKPMPGLLHEPWERAGHGSLSIAA